MRTFTVECPNPDCDCEMDVDIEETDLADTELGHIVTCADCQTETEFVYDADLDELVPADEDDESDEADDLLLAGSEDDEEDDEDDGESEGETA